MRMKHFIAALEALPESYKDLKDVEDFKYTIDDNVIILTHPLVMPLIYNYKYHRWVSVRKLGNLVNEQA